MRSSTRAVLIGAASTVAIAAAVIGVVFGSRGPGSGLVPSASAASLAPNRSLQARDGQFLAVCPFSHDAPDDPIVHRGMPGMSHLHEFFGNTTTDAASAFTSLVGTSSTCSDDGDRSAYWVPALYIDGVRVAPRRVDAYYRIPEGVEASTVQPMPSGLQALAGNQFATTSQSLGVVAWTCGLSPALSSTPPRTCEQDRPLQLRLTFPSCWDGTHLATADHTSHLAYPGEHGCPASHPVAIPQLTLAVHYPVTSSFTTVKLASGDVRTAHGDFFDGWQPARMREQVLCLQRQVMCGLAGGTFHTGMGAGDDDHYSLPGTGDGYEAAPTSSNPGGY